MTPAGLRSLFRHHRLRSRVPQANPHRFRHTFGADMVRAGISLPALQHLMGHSQIHTTMLYVQLAPQDVWREYARAVANRARLILSADPMSPPRANPRTDLRSAHPDPFPDSAAWHRVKLRICGAPLPRVSSRHAFPRSAVSRNSVAIPICWAGSVGFANSDPPIGNHTRDSTCSVFAVCSTIWPSTAIPSSPASFSARTFPAAGISAQSLCLRKTINDCKRNCAVPTTCYSNALLLTRVTGIRIGECIHLPLDCLRHVGPEQWALHVPLGKLHTERLVPLDAEGLRLLCTHSGIACSGLPGPSGEIRRLPVASRRRSVRPVSNAARRAGRFRQASGLCRHEPDLASPLAPHLGLGHAPLRD